jgi:hypothetical protein
MNGWLAPGLRFVAEGGAMRRLSILAFFVGFLAIGAAETARAATLDFTGTLTIQVSGSAWQPFVILGAGTAQVSDDGSLHLVSLSLPGGTFGPASTTIDGYDDLRFWSVANLSGAFTGVSGGSPLGSGVMGISGLAKICITIFDPTCEIAYVPLPISPTARGGFGIGGTQVTSPAVVVTVQHAPWTIDQPVMTIHSRNSTAWTPSLPGGFAHGPASLTSSTAQPSGVVQLVTASKVFTSLTGAYPEFPLTGVLTLHFVPEPGTLMLLGSVGVALAVLGRRRGGR